MSQSEEDTKPADEENVKLTDEEKLKLEEKKVEDEKRMKPLIPKSAIMRLLAELVKSYINCAQLIAQHMFIAGQSELIAEVTLSA